MLRTSAETLGGTLSHASMAGSMGGASVSGRLGAASLGAELAPREIQGSLSGAALSGSVALATSIADYHGPYEVTPTREAQVLPTAGRRMASDVVVNPIPSNYGLITWNGATLTVS